MHSQPPWSVQETGFMSRPRDGREGRSPSVARLRDRYFLGYKKKRKKKEKKVGLYNPLLIPLTLSSDSKVQMEKKAFSLFGLYQLFQIDANGKLIV